MRQIRQNTFETNSSSTHSLVLCTEDEFNRWKSGETLLDTNTHRFVIHPDLSVKDYRDAQTDYVTSMTKYMKRWDDLTKEEKKEYVVDYIRSRDDIDYLETYDQFTNSDLEWFMQRYTSPSGDKVVAFGRYGYD